MYSAAEVIRVARRTGGLSQRELSDRSGVSQPNIAAYENGSRAPSLAMLERLVESCGQQIRLQLEPRWADVDRDIVAVLAGTAHERMSGAAFYPFVTASRLYTNGAPVVLDGHLAARA